LRNLEMARDYAQRAARCLREAQLALTEGDPPMAVRRSQEALELAVKALLRALGIEYPRSYDVSDALLEHRGRLPQPIRGKVEDLARLVSDLAAVRGPAFYGYEREGIPASRAFTRSYAERVYRRVEEYVTEIKRLIDALPQED